MWNYIKSLFRRSSVNIPVVFYNEYTIPHIEVKWYRTRNEKVRELAYYLSLEDSNRREPEHYWYIAESIINEYYV